MSETDLINALIVEMRELAIAASFDEMDEPTRFDRVLTQAADTIERLLADRDAQVREAFMAGRTARRRFPHGRWLFTVPASMAEAFQRNSEEAFAAFQARPSSGGAGTAEQE